jgi:hypothetical protein
MNVLHVERHATINIFLFLITMTIEELLDNVGGMKGYRFSLQLTGHGKLKFSIWTSSKFYTSRYFRDVEHLNEDLPGFIEKTIQKDKEFTKLYMNGEV